MKRSSAQGFIGNNLAESAEKASSEILSRLGISGDKSSTSLDLKSVGLMTSGENGKYCVCLFDVGVCLLFFLTLLLFFVILVMI